MSNVIAPSRREGPSAVAAWREYADRRVRAAMEGLLLVLVCLAPWAYGAVHPGYVMLLYTGVAALLTLWGLRALLRGYVWWYHSGIALCLAALFILAVGQLAPLSRSWLVALSPGTAHLYEQVLPSQPEQLPADISSEVPPLAAGDTVSLCPGTTQQTAIRLLAVILVFAVVRNNLATPACLWRLSVALLINGVLLALFALVQYFSWGSHLLYGLYPTKGAAFGPFICRNHFPYYANMCLGLSVGLLVQMLAGSRAPSDGPANSSARRNSNGSSRSRRGFLDGGLLSSTFTTQTSRSNELLAWLNQLFQQPWALAIGFAIVLMAASIIFSLSRGGVLALLGSTLVCVLIQPRPGRSLIQMGMALLLIGVITVGLLSWFGLEGLESRWEPGLVNDPSTVDRPKLWLTNLPSFTEFPVWGTGYGTFRYTELLHRKDPKLEGMMYEHAHNDYLELLLEGGLAGLLPALLAIGLLFRAGYLAVRQQRSDGSAWLASGALFGMTAVILHSSVDFGLHIPAVALLATVLAAHLSAQGQMDRQARAPAALASEEGEAGPPLQLQGGLAPAGAALLLVLFAGLLVQEGWRGHRAERFRAAADSLNEDSRTDPAARSQQLTYLRAAISAAPENPRLRLELARAHLASYLEASFKIQKSGLLRSSLQMLTHCTAIGTPSGPMPLLPGLTSAAAFQDRSRQELTRGTREEGLQTVSAMIEARNACPIENESQLELASLVFLLPGAEPREAYLQRAKLLSPVNTTVWYICGLDELLDGHEALAWQSWQRSLELSSMHLPQILKDARLFLSPQEILTSVLPDRPRVLYEAALLLYPSEDSLEERRPFLEKALALLEQPPPGPTALEQLLGPRTTLPQAEDLFLQGLIADSLGQKKKALAAYSRAVVRDPARGAYRLHYAQRLHEEGQLREAERELLTFLHQNHGHEEAKELLDVVRREIAQQR